MPLGNGPSILGKWAQHGLLSTQPICHGENHQGSHYPRNQLAITDILKVSNSHFYYLHITIYNPLSECSGIRKPGESCWWTTCIPFEACPVVSNLKIPVAARMHTFRRIGRNRRTRQRLLPTQHWSTYPGICETGQDNWAVGANRCVREGQFCQLPWNYNLNRIRFDM